MWLPCPYMVKTLKKSLDKRMKYCLNGPGHMTNVAAMPIYGKNLKKSSLEPKGR